MRNRFLGGYFVRGLLDRIRGGKKEKKTNVLQPQETLLNKCIDCASMNLIQDCDAGEIVCGDCGLVQNQQMMDRGPEWRAFNPEEYASRIHVGFPTLYSVFDKGLSTVIDQSDRDASGTHLSRSTRLQMWRLRKWQARSRVSSSIDRNLAQAMTELERLSDKIHLPKPIKEKGAVIYRKALEKGLIRGRSIAGIVTASLYVACRANETRRTLREMSEASLVDQSEVARCYRLLLRELNVQIPLDDSLTYFSKIAEKTGLSGKTQGIAISILRRAKKIRAASSKSPMGLAAAALYIACLQNNEKITQKEIAEAAEVTEVTVRNRYKAIRWQLKLELPGKSSLL